VLLNFSQGNRLSNMTVIDWEFVSVGPAFIDVGNFIGELFCTAYLNSVDAAYAEVLESFVRAYRASGIALDTRRAAAFASVGIIQALPRRMTLSRGATQTMAMACVEHALDLMASAGGTTDRDDPFAPLSKILSDNARPR
jgi:hypothetical protein